MRYGERIERNGLDEILEEWEMKKILWGFGVGALAGLVAEVGVMLAGGLDTAWGWLPFGVSVAVYLFVCCFRRGK